MSRRGKFLSLILGLSAFISVSYSNCAKSNLSSPASEKQIVKSGDSSPYVLICDSGQAEKSSYKVLEKTFELSNNKIPSYMTDVSTFNVDEKFLVVVDNDCLRMSGAQSIITQAVVRLGIRDSAKISAYPVQFSSLEKSSDLVAAANHDQCVISLDYNQTLTLDGIPISNDPQYIQQNHLKFIKHDEVYGYLHNSNNGINQTVRVAVIDSGVDVYHPDLNDHILKSSSGQIIGYNPMIGFDPKDVVDSGSHGTHVAGLIAAEADNGLGVSSVMGKNIKIVPIKVSTDGRSIDLDAVVSGIFWAVEQNVDVINMSIGGLSRISNQYPILGQAPAPQALQDAIRYAIKNGVTLLAAAGNDGLQFGNLYTKSNGTQFYNNPFPGALGKDFKGLITVGSIDDATGGRSCFSNFGSAFVELMAPGAATSTANAAGSCISFTGVRSTVPATQTGGYGLQAGTSMATPVAAGATAVLIGLARSRGYEIYPEQVEDILMASAAVNSNLSSVVGGGKFLDLKKLVDYIDAESHLLISSSQDRSSAYGNISIQTHPLESQIVNEGATASLNVQLSAGSTRLVSYQWYKNGRPILGAIRPELKIEKASEYDGDRYYVIAKAGSSVLKSKTSTLIIRKTCN